MRLLHQDHPLDHRRCHHHHHQQQQQQQELLQKHQTDQQELQRQRILSLFESSPPHPELSEDHHPDLQAAPSFDPYALPRPDETPRAGGAASVDVVEGGGCAAVGAQARVGARAGADMQVRKRRGRPPRLNGGGCGAVVSYVAGRREDEEEDVCFICFDGGTLVLCDRRGCPKAYHPACIKRDESFFRSKAKWNCGWHICSSCQKASYYLCYTCTYSLCKNCTRGADYVCVRGTKGLCGTCMKIIMLIESVEHRNKEMVQVDFDDKLSWEYLFKVYWICLKDKLSLTFEELTSAKNPWKDPGISIDESIGVLNTIGVEIHDLGSFKNQVGNGLNGMKRTREKLFRNEVDGGNRLSCGQSSDGRDWASKELLEFVSHMKNGDTSVLSQFDVEALLLEYAKRNNLRDPQRKCQIICDSRLFSLFGKGVVGHFEMLKLLEYHILAKVDTRVQAVTDTDAPMMKNGTSGQSHQILARSKRRRNRKKIVEKVHSINQEDQAAIDVHNINLIYLRRDLLEKLVNDYGSFHEKAVGCFVRIKISSDDPKQEIYRLVQIIGKSELDEPNKTDGGIGKVILEILNADKKESIPINELSNQEFSEDECRRLRESIKSGLTKRLTLGDILKKAIALHAIKTNDWLETEIMRVKCLRERASEKGHLKELRECVEKLQLLSSPEERQRRLNDLPEVHKDPNMDPDYKSDVAGGPRTIGRSTAGRKRKASIPQETGDIVLRETRSRSQRKRASSENQDAKIPVAAGIHRGSSHPTFEMNGSARVQAQEVSAISSSMTEINGGQVIAAIAGERYNNGSGGSASHSVVVSEITPSPLSTGTDQSVNDTEIYKIWHYRDPQGRVQGPFTLLQLRKWTLNGHFPTDLRIWRTDEIYEDSILLTEALSGRHTRGQALPLKESDNRQDSLTSGCMDTNIVRKDSRSGSPCKADNEVVISNGLVKPSYCRASAVDDVKVASTEEQTKNILSIMLDFAISGEASLRQDKSGDPVQLPEEVPKSYLTSHLRSSQERASERDCQNVRVDSISVADQLSGQNWVNQLSVRDAVNGSSGPNVRQEELETSTQKKGDFSSPMPEIGREELKTHISENMQSSANIPARDTTNPSWSTSTSSLVACDPPPLPPDEVTGEWVVYSTAPSNGWESGLVSAPSFSPDEIAIDHTSATNSGSGQLMHSPPQSIPDTTAWQAHDFGALAEESVSDLLAEVEAMESMGGLPSPTSKLKSAPDLAIEDGKDDCFNPVDGFSPPPPDPGKGEAFATTNHLEAPPQPIIAEISHASSDNHSLPDQRKPVTSTTLPREIPRGTNWDVTPIATDFAAVSVNADASWGAVQGNRHTGYAGTNHGNAAVDWDIRLGTAASNGNICYGSMAGGPIPTVWSNQQRFGNSGGNRYPGWRDRGSYQGADIVGFNRNRSSAWIKQYSGGGSGGGGGSFQQSPRGQRVCKFNEAGYCKKGASCGYLHR